MMRLSDDVSFNAVNRDVNYLRASGARFADQHGLKDQWLAEQGGVIKPPRIQRKRRARRSSTTHHSQLGPLDREVRMLAEAHRFISPIDVGLYWISSPYGPRRMSNGAWGFHYGVDMAAPYGTAVKAADHGVVIEAGWVKGFGKMVMISHGAHYKTRYAHLSSIKVEVGDHVVQGQLIGRVGNSGHTRGKNGVHLHWEVIGYGGKRFNPQIFLQRARNT